MYLVILRAARLVDRCLFTQNGQSAQNLTQGLEDRCGGFCAWAASAATTQYVAGKYEHKGAEGDYHDYQELFG